MLVDLETHCKRRKPNLVQKTFYGQLQHLFTTHPGLHHPNMSVNNIERTTIIIAAIHNHIIDTDYLALGKLNIQYPSHVGELHYIDVTSIQCLVAHVRDSDTHQVVGKSLTASFSLIGDVKIFLNYGVHTSIGQNQFIVSSLSV